MNVDSERAFSSNSYQNKIKKYFNNATTNAINFYPSSSACEYCYNT